MLGTVDYLVEALDVSSDAAVEAFCGARLAAEEHDFSWHTAYSTAETMVAFRSPEYAERRVVLQARSGAQVVGVAAAILPLLDNTNSAALGVAVVPTARRHGVGSALLAALVEHAGPAGRDELTGWLQWPYDAGRGGSTSPGMQFAAHHGFEVNQLEIQRVLDLPVDDAILDRLATKAAPHHEGYTFRTWTGGPPQELIAAYGHFIGSVETEAPTGEHPPEIEVWDEKRIRQEQDELRGQRRTRITTMAFASNGEPAGYTDLIHAAADGGRVYQWGTLVDRAHRGRRLGVALKVRTTRAMQQAFPDAPYVRTWNAESNVPMIAVNDAMGFRPVGWAADLHRQL